MILPKERDPRLITIRRGGPLTDDDHHLLGLCAAACAHDLGAAAYAIKAARAAAPPGREDEAGRLECAWQREQLPSSIRDLVLEDEHLRNDICWSVFFTSSAKRVEGTDATP